MKLKETNTSRSSVTESNEEKPVHFLSCVVQHATGHSMIKLMASVEFISDQSRDPDLHSSSRSRERICLNGIFIAFSPEGINRGIKESRGRKPRIKDKRSQTESGPVAR